jgi:hypothetical protein
MVPFCAYAGRVRRSGWVAGLVSSMTILAPAVWAQDPIIRVEEDWALLLNEPDNGVVAPQFHTVMSPVCNLDAHYALVTWNYRVDYSYEGEFAPGGLQLQAWNGEDRLRRVSIGEAELSKAPEFITWTQRLDTNGVQLNFEIFEGEGASWGWFGDEMRITSEAAYPNLDEYCTDTSAGNSWITFGSNRVDGLAIMQVRRYSANGLVSVDSTPRIVFVREDD